MRKMIVGAALLISTVFLASCKNGDHSVGMPSISNGSNHSWVQRDRDDRYDNRDLLPIVVGGKWGYIDRDGVIKITPQYDAAEGFIYDLADVCIGACRFDEKGGKHGLLGMDGRFVVNPTYGKIGSTDGDLIAVCQGTCDYNHKDNKWGYVDRHGNMVIAPQFGDAGDFSEGLAAVCVGTVCDSFTDGNGKWGFIDKTGKFIVNPQYDDASPMSGGRAKVQVGRMKLEKKEGEIDDVKVGYIDATGKVIYAPTN